MRSSIAAKVGGIALLWIVLGTACNVDWPQFGFDPGHSGYNPAETRISPVTVSRLTRLFQVTLPAIADGAPAYLGHVATLLGTRDLVFLTTKAGHLLALDARTGATVWTRQYPAGACRINGGPTPCYTTSSPAIDPSRLFVYGYGLDGRVHKFHVGDGTEVTTGGWPELTTLKGEVEKGSSALSIATAGNGRSFLYVTNGGYPGDQGDYQGHVTAIDLATGAQRVFNAACSDQTVHFVVAPATPNCPHVQSAIWAREGIVYDPVTDKIFMTTGNGDFDGATGGFDWGDTVLSLNPDGTGAAGKPLDTYTPVNFLQLQITDADLGSTAPAILPAPGFAGRLAVQSGKDVLLRLINLASLNGQGGPGHVGGDLGTLPVPQGGQVLTAPAVWVNPADGATWVFVSNGSGISGLKLTVAGGFPSLAPVWQRPHGGSSPIIANGVLFQAGGAVLRAYAPTTGEILWSDATQIGAIHWESPIVANGVLYATDESSRLTALTVP